MQDEELDNRIREAASQHHPPYDDKAWEKMEQLLDKHMPQEKDRRRWIFFLLLFLLTGGGLFLFIARPWKGGDHTTVSQNNAPAGNKNSSNGNNTTSENGTTNTPNPGNDNPAITHTGNSGEPLTADNSAGSLSNNKNASVSTGNPPAVANSGTAKNSLTPGTNKRQGINPINTNEAPGFNAGAPGRSRQKVTNSNPASFAAVNTRKKKNHPASKLPADAMALENRYDKQQQRARLKSKLNTEVQSPDAVEDALKNTGPENNLPAGKPAGDEKKKPNQPDAGKNTAATKPENKITNPDKDKITAITEKAKEATPVAGTKGKEKKKTPRGFGNNFGLTVSTGSDVSFISTNKPGKTTFFYGGGMSYTFAKRVTVRTGFYVSKKIYAATPEQYHNTTYPYLTGIDADCKIYQIPLSISYSFGQRKKHSWFGSAGLTSLLMKKENYEYNYKNPSGQTYSYYRNIDNENKHYFSMLSLSAGYQRNLSNRVAVAAEPYVNIPLKGVGYGKVKLKTAGVQVSVIVKPFARKNK